MAGATIDWDAEAALPLGVDLGAASCANSLLRSAETTTLRCVR